MEAAGTKTSQTLWGRAGAGFRAIPGQVKRWRGCGGGGGGGRSLTGPAWSWPGWQENRRLWGSGWDAGCGATPHLTTRNYASARREETNGKKGQKTGQRGKTQGEKKSRTLERESEKLCLHFNHLWDHRLYNATIFPTMSIKHELPTRLRLKSRLMQLHLKFTMKWFKMQDCYSGPV